MKKVLIKAIIVVIISLTIVKILSIWDNIVKPVDETVIRIQQAEHFLNPEYLFIGPSYTYMGINSYIFDSINISTYNLGSYGAGCLVYDIILNDYLNLGGKPKNVVICVSPYVFSHQSDLWFNYPIHRYLKNPLNNEIILKDLYGNVFKSDYTLREYAILNINVINQYYKTYRSSLKKTLKNLLINTSNDQLRNAIIKKVRNNKGYYFDSDVIYPNSLLMNEDEYKKNQDHYISLNKYVYDSYKMEKLVDIINSLRASRINVILHKMPSLNIDSYFSNSYLKKYRDDISNLIKVTGVEYIDDKDFKVERKYFSDLEHLNDLGAKQYTHFLINKLGIKKQN